MAKRRKKQSARAKEFALSVLADIISGVIVAAIAKLLGW